ncbi:hypothetical protein AB0M87_14525 [Streptomyces sp. NPDC051320]|uniref:hypothetical protein n=1 Tax=Streptomyces sp. NPDC051320 TaxID=3154644 RepID=UPI00344572E5
MRGTRLGAAALLAGAAILCGATTATADPGPIDVAQDSPLTEIVGTTAGTLADDSAPCAAPWADQGFDGDVSYACQRVQINQDN